MNTETTKSFDNFFTLIFPKLKEMEDVRIAGSKNLPILKKLCYTVLVLMILDIVFIPFLKFLSLGLFFLFGFALLLLFGQFTQIINETVEKLTPPFKSEVIAPLLNYFYEDVNYIPRQRISVKLLQKSLLFNRVVAKNSGDDYTDCRIGDTYIQFSEVQAYGVIGSYFFNGFFIAVEFNKSFTKKTIVIPNAKKSFFRKIGISVRGEMKNAKRIVLEDLDFKKEFVVIGEDQVESRYLLSTSLMQRILDYKRKVHKDVAFSFIDNRLYVAIPTKLNLFEPKITKPITDKEFIQSNYDYFKLLTDLVNDLDLNTKIWI